MPPKRKSTAKSKKKSPPDGSRTVAINKSVEKPNLRKNPKKKVIDDDPAKTAKRLLERVARLML